MIPGKVIYSNNNFLCNLKFSMKLFHTRDTGSDVKVSTFFNCGGVEKE